MKANQVRSYSTLTKLIKPTILNSSDNRGEKPVAYEEIMRNDSVEPIFRDLALILWGYDNLSRSEPSRITTTLARLNDSASPWRHSAREIIALSEKRAGNKGKARSILRGLIDDVTTPNGIRSRASEILSLMKK